METTTDADLLKRIDEINYILNVKTIEFDDAARANKAVDAAELKEYFDLINDGKSCAKQYRKRRMDRVRQYRRELLEKAYAAD